MQAAFLVLYSVFALCIQMKKINLPANYLKRTKTFLTLLLAFWQW